MLLVVAMYAVAVLATPAALPHAIAQWYTKTTNPNKNGLSRFFRDVHATPTDTH